MTSLPVMGLLSGGYFDPANPGKVPESAKLDYSDPYAITSYMPPVKEIYMNIPDTLRDACLAKVRETMRPLEERIEVVERMLGKYRAEALKVAEQSVVGAVLAALGQKAPETHAEAENAAKALREALVSLLELVGGEQPTIEQPTVESEPEPEESAPFSPPPSPPSSPGKVAQPEANPVDVESARRLLNEIGTENFDDQHHLRLVPLLQAFTAEVRWLMSRLPSTHPLHWQLSHTIRYLSRVRFEQEVDDFIKGLSRDHRANWDRLAREARSRVAKFDLDAQAAPSRKSTPNAARKNGNGNGESKATHNWPAWASLRQQLAAGKSLLIVGGWHCQDKAKTIKERFGLEPDWYETDPASPRCSENAVAKIKGGKLVGVVVLEGFMTHKDWRRISDACVSISVPMAMANRAGVGSLEVAFAEIDRKLGT